MMKNCIRGYRFTDMHGCNIVDLWGVMAAQMKKQQIEKEEYVLKYKIAYTVMILTVYLLGRNIPLCGVDFSSCKSVSLDVQTLLMQTISENTNRYCLFALGISPFMLSSILIQMFIALREIGSSTRLSLRKVSRIQAALTLGIALFQAVERVQSIPFSADGSALFALKILVILEMLTGTMLLLWLANRNRKYGIGGQTVIIYVNIISGIMMILLRHNAKTLVLPLAISAAVMVITLLMEGGEKRIPMQRISIYNIYADKNYLAIKMNPAGVMPVMFSTAFFMLPKMAADALRWLFPENLKIIWWQENLMLTKPLGIEVYIVILYLLTIGFSMIIISPSRIAEQFLKGGDSILNLYAGKDTHRYLFRQVFGTGFFSASLMSLCLGIPMFLQLGGKINGELAMLPSSIMMLTSLWYNLYQEFTTLKSYEAYQPFI